MRGRLAVFVASFALTAALPAQPSAGVLAGVVWDSTGGVPLAGARVLLAPVGRPDLPAASADADSAGRWVVSGLAPGEWMATFLHPASEVYGVSPVPRAATVRAGDTARIALGLP